MTHEQITLKVNTEEKINKIEIKLKKGFITEATARPRLNVLYNKLNKINDNE